MELLYGLGGLLFYGYFLTFIGMGFVQPIAAVIRILCAKRQDSEYAIGLKNYLLAVFLYFSVWYIAVGSGMAHDANIIGTLYILVLPWVYAIWYIRHTRKWSKKFKNIAKFDKVKQLNAPHEDRLLLESYPTKKVKIDNFFNHTKETLPQKAIIKTLPQLSLAK